MKKLINKIFISALVIVFIAGFTRADLANRINSIINRSLQEGVTFSIRIVKVETGDTVYERNAREPLIPASNMKLVTTASALRYLGADFEYNTKVGLYGDSLVIIGSGDPLLGDEQTDAKYDRKKGWIFEDIAKKLKRNNVATIGDIIVDTGVFDNECVHPSWPAAELNRSYACEVSGLNFNLNCIKLSAKNNGGRVNIFIEPQTSFVTLINEVKPIKSGESSLGTYRNRQPNKLTVFGECRNEYGPIEVAIEEPPAYFGYLLFEHLTEESIETKGRFIEKVLEDTGDFKLLAEYKTTLKDCLDRCHKDSLNLGAEALMKTIAAIKNPNKKRGSWERGQELIGEYLVELGIDREKFNIDDGCGLSRQNRLSAEIITKVLLNVYNSDNWEMYKDSLAVGGVEGTSSIADNFKDEKYKGKVLGKSGYINGVKSLSGVCITAGGDYIFSVITNNANGLRRMVINNIAEAIIDDAEDK